MEKFRETCSTVNDRVESLIFMLIDDRQLRNEYFRTTNIVEVFKLLSLFIEDKALLADLSTLVHAFPILTLPWREKLEFEKIVQEIIIN